MSSEKLDDCDGVLVVLVFLGVQILTPYMDASDEGFPCPAPVQGVSFPPCPTPNNLLVSSTSPSWVLWFTSSMGGEPEHYWEHHLP